MLNLMLNGRGLPRLIFTLSVCSMLAMPASVPSASAREWPSGSSSGAATQTPLAYSFIPSERAVYHLSYNSSSMADFSKLFADQKGSRSQSTPANSFKTSIDGELTATVLEKREDGAVIAYRLQRSSVSLITNDQSSADQAAKIAQDLERDLFAFVNQSGKIIAVWLDPAVDDISQNFARALLAMLQFVLPDQKLTAQRDWQTKEEDPNGQYVARYEAAPDATTRQDSPALKIFRKTKLRYLKSEKKLKPGEFEAPITVIPKGELIARFDASTHSLISIHGSESQTVVISETPVGHSETSVRLSLVKTDSVNAVSLARLRSECAAREKRVTVERLSAVSSDQAAEVAIQRSALGQQTLETLLADLDKLKEPGDQTDKNKSDAAANDESSLYLRFKALVYVEPDSSAALAKLLAVAEPKSAKMRVLAGALGIVGHKQAQAALVSAIRSRPDDWPAQSVLIPTLGTVGEPTQLTEDTLRDFAFNARNTDIASTAQLSLGALAHNLADKSPERADKIIDDLVAQLDSSTSGEKTRQILLVLGNAGSARALPALTKYLHSHTPSIRAAAVSALRWMIAPSINTLLIAALASDEDDSVRNEAAVALSFRDMDADTFKAQKQVFLQDKSVTVRLTVLGNLWKARESFPESRQLVTRAAESDTSKDVRSAAADIIRAFPKSYFK